MEDHRPRIGTRHQCVWCREATAVWPITLARDQMVDDVLRAAGVRSESEAAGSSRRAAWHSIGGGLRSRLWWFPRLRPRLMVRSERMRTAPKRCLLLPGRYELENWAKTRRLASSLGQ